MANNIPFLTGEESIFKFYQDGAAVYLPTKSWSVDENAVEIADGVNGENRDRLDKKTNYFEINLEMFMNNMDIVQAYIAAQQADDAHEFPLLQVAGMQFLMRDGTKAAYKLTEVKAGPMKIGSGGRTDRTMFTLKLRARYFEPTKAF